MVWATRTGNGTDDLMFEFFGNPEDYQEKGCRIAAKSRAKQGGIEKDSGRNFCNVWNVLAQVSKTPAEEEMFKKEPTVGECSVIPKDPATACASTSAIDAKASHFTLSFKTLTDILEYLLPSLKDMLSKVGISIPDLIRYTSMVYPVSD